MVCALAYWACSTQQTEPARGNCPAGESDAATQQRPDGIAHAGLFAGIGGKGLYFLFDLIHTARNQQGDLVGGDASVTDFAQRALCRFSSFVYSGDGLHRFRSDRLI